MAVANGQYFGGGMWIAPKAKVDDGLFDIVILGDLSVADMALRSGDIYKGKHLNWSKVSYLQGKKLVATSSEEVLLDVDGEPLGRLPATFEILTASILLKG